MIVAPAKIKFLPRKALLLTLGFCFLLISLIVRHCSKKYNKNHLHFPSNLC